MRFTCEKCGRAYAADEGLAVRGFRIRCRQCGELIVVPARGAPAGSVPSAVGTPLPGGMGRAGQTGAIPVGLRERSPGDREDDPFATLARELAAVPEAPPLPPSDPWLAPPPGGEELDPAAGAPVEGPGTETDRALTEIGRRMDATTGSTPLGVWAGKVVGLETVTPPPRAAPEPGPRAAAGPPPGHPRPPVPPAARKWMAAGLGLVAGVAGAVAIALLLDRGAPPEALPAPARAPAAPAAPAAAARPAATSEARAAPAREPVPRQEPPRAKAPPQAKGPPQAKPHEGKARLAAARRPETRPATRPAARPKAPVEGKAKAPVRPESKPPVHPAASPPAAPAVATGKPPSPPAPAPRADRQLGDLQIQATIARHADSFQACAEQARREEPQLLADTRRVTITMTVTPGGRVLYPTLDDAELSGSALGGCLKREAGRMGFPPSEGEAVRVRMPLVLR